MKKSKIVLTALFVLITIISISCTDNSSARNWGGTETIQLEPRQKFLNVTWKDDDLWVLTGPADSNFVPKIYSFEEHSSYGAMEGTIIISENK